MELEAKDLSEIRVFNLWKENSDNEWVCIGVFTFDEFWDYIEHFHEDLVISGVKRRSSIWLWQNCVFILREFMLAMPNFIPSENGF